MNARGFPTPVLRTHTHTCAHTPAHALQISRVLNTYLHSTYIEPLLHAKEPDAKSKPSTMATPALESDRIRDEANHHSKQEAVIWPLTQSLPSWRCFPSSVWVAPSLHTVIPHPSGPPWLPLATALLSFFPVIRISLFTVHRPLNALNVIRISFSFSKILLFYAISPQ